MNEVVSSQTESKVYLEIVKQLRQIISKEKLKPGDKLPSERELSERLNVGRSSVREALRALELLGLIETRRGEGTFIRDFRGNQLVQLLSTFILEDEKAKKDVLETKYLIEMDCLKLAIDRYSSSAMIDLKEEVVLGQSVDDENFFYSIAVLADNHLLMRIWLILNDYFKALEIKHCEKEKDLYLNIIASIESGNKKKALIHYQNLRNLSNS
ncbi:FadR/GntR family transcriptional regulator [Neobacillus sp. D3-1R]|uniref:FadR/GntR family transcriptional regulator n=1 Tax=Neobacillus sp. D3-1R TaxID=3445778 RepID=UPI003F9FCFD8